MSFREQSYAAKSPCQPILAFDILHVGVYAGHARRRFRDSIGSREMGTQTPLPRVPRLRDMPTLHGLRRKQTMFCRVAAVATRSAVRTRDVDDRQWYCRIQRCSPCGPVR